MNLPSSFTTWAPLGGKAHKVAVELRNGEIFDVWPKTGGGAEFAIDAECQQTARAWAVKSLAWLRQEASKASAEDIAIRDVEAKAEALKDALANMAQFGVSTARTELMREAARDFLSIREVTVENLRNAHMRDLMDRMAAEMERQASEAAKSCPYCHEAHSRLTQCHRSTP
jgi:hypothetical protein